MKNEKRERYIKIGEDGALLAGDASEWVAVLDTHTNLMWAVEVLQRQAWKKALKAPEKLATAGFKDWRLPTVEELFYLADRTRSNPAIDKDFFPDTPSSWFWSSTPYSASPFGRRLVCRLRRRLLALRRPEPRVLRSGGPLRSQGLTSMSRYTITLGIPKPDLPAGREEWQQSVQEMRAAVTRAQRDSNLVRQCNYRADLDGLNGEDRMTLIAYFALRALEDKVQQDVERLLLDPRPPVLKPAGGFDDD